MSGGRKVPRGRSDVGKDRAKHGGRALGDGGPRRVQATPTSGRERHVPPSRDRASSVVEGEVARARGLRSRRRRGADESDSRMLEGLPTGRSCNNLRLGRGRTVPDVSPAAGGDSGERRASTRPQGGRQRTPTMLVSERMRPMRTPPADGSVVVFDAVPGASGGSRPRPAGGCRDARAESQL